MREPLKHLSKPPRFFHWLLRWFCARELLEELEGDLEEAYYQNLNSKSTTYANFKYAREVIHLVRPSVIRNKSEKMNSTTMIANYGKVAVRQFIKNRTYVIINILGMSIGLACCIVSYLNYQYNRSFDHQHSNLENLYRINYQEEDDSKIRQYGMAPIAMGVELLIF